MSLSKENSKRKLEEQKNEYDRYTKRQYRTLLLQEIGWEAQRGIGTNYRCFTLHGTGKLEEDNMEFWEKKRKDYVIPSEELWKEINSSMGPLYRSNFGGMKKSNISIYKDRISTSTSLYMDFFKSW